MTSSVFMSWAVMMSPSFSLLRQWDSFGRMQGGIGDGPLAGIEVYYQRVKEAKDKRFIMLTECWLQWHAAWSVRL